MAIPLLGLIGKAVGSVFGIIDKSVTDKDLANQLKQQIQAQLLVNDIKALESQANIIIAEAQGHSWLQRNWRPITMLAMVAFIGAHWLGLSPETLSEKEILSLFDLVKIGLGGYVVGRSGEKIASSYFRAKE